VAPRVSISTDGLRRAFWCLFVALAVLVMVSAGYYVWDRYTHPDEQPAAEAGVAQMEEAIRHDPSDPDLRVALAEAYLVAGQYQDALSQAEQVATLYPEHEAALLIAGLAAARLDRPGDALAPLGQFVAQRQGGPMARADMALETAYYFLGESYLKLGRPGEAIPALEAALEIDAVDADALYQAGLAYQATGQPETALQRYHDAVRLVPDFVEAYRGMSEIYRTMDQAGYAMYARGMVAFCERDHAAAAANLERATQALPDFGPAFRGLGLTYEQMGQLGEALAALQRALALAPDDLASLQAIGRIQATLNAEN